MVTWTPPRAANGIIQRYEVSYSNIEADEGQTVTLFVRPFEKVACFQ
jgi:hypothetical protein